MLLFLASLDVATVSWTKTQEKDTSEGNDGFIRDPGCTQCLAQGRLEIWIGGTEDEAGNLRLTYDISISLFTSHSETTGVFCYKVESLLYQDLWVLIISFVFERSWVLITKCTSDVV